MPRQNRVTPMGDLIAVPERGLMFGNRGVLHNPQQRIVRYSQGQRWLVCRLEFRGRHRDIMQPDPTPSSSSLTRQPHWRPDTGPARSAATLNISSSASVGSPRMKMFRGNCRPPSRSTPSCTQIAWQQPGSGRRTAMISPHSLTASSYSGMKSRGSCGSRHCCIGLREATIRTSLLRNTARSRSSAAGHSALYRLRIHSHGPPFGPKIGARWQHSPAQMRRGTHLMM